MSARATAVLELEPFPRALVSFRPELIQLEQIQPELIQAELIQAELTRSASSILRAIRRSAQRGSGRLCLAA